MKKTFLHKVLCGMVCFVSVLCASGMQKLDAKPSKQEKRVTLSLKNVPLKQALTDIERQTQYLFFNKDVDYSRNVSIKIKNATTEEVCSALLTPLGIAYEIQKSNIVIFMAPKAKPYSQSGGGQSLGSGAE